ncbi:uncharacterized protein [Dermacentor albipictus]|uniref:uncharacterized protein n=1 Tax=Dermacentor albipictus TaxID=60249 RepID=UPI0038FC768B
MLTRDRCHHLAFRDVVEALRLWSKTQRLSFDARRLRPEAVAQTLHQVQNWSARKWLPKYRLDSAYGKTRCRAYYKKLAKEKKKRKENPAPLYQKFSCWTMKSSQCSSRRNNCKTLLL